MSISGKDATAVQERVTQILGPELATNAVTSAQPATYTGQIGHVHVSVPMKNASPDLLWFIGFGLADRTLQSRSSMVMERIPPPITNSPDLSTSLSPTPSTQL
jgi:hypothetical protein